MRIMSLSAPLGSGGTHVLTEAHSARHARSMAPTLEGPSNRHSGHEGAQPGVSLARAKNSGLEERAAAQLRFRRAFTVGYAIWAAFAGIDWMVVRYLDARSLLDLAIPRFAVLVAVLPLLIRLYRSPPIKAVFPLSPVFVAMLISYKGKSWKVKSKK